MNRLPSTKGILKNGSSHLNTHVPLTRRYATALSNRNVNQEKITDVAVLGGGITGLATAFFLTRSLPAAKITLFEASPRLGGWLHSKQVDVGNGKVVFEQGPRNLRPSVPNGLITLDLVRDLELEDRLLMTSKDSSAAQNRFIYYPDHLVRMPGSGSTILRTVANLWSEPIFSGIISAALTEVTIPRRPDEMRDESIGSFLSRRFGSALTDNLASAVFHGIYAGDIYNLSARSILSGPWQVESRHDSILKGLLASTQMKSQPMLTEDLEIAKQYQKQPNVSREVRAARKASVFTFKGGIGDLADGLEKKLLKSPNVNIKKSVAVTGMHISSAAPKINVETYAAGQWRKTTDFSHVVSTVAGNKLAEIARDKSTRDLMPILRQTGSVTVMVVNLFFSNSNILPINGFGYLLPRSIPFEQNPERALGVIFDSDACLGQDSASGTKITVMLGGHWWDDFTTFPDEEEGASMAKAILKRHLGISEEPRAVRVSIQSNCIPQYRVGHDDRMAAASQILEGWKGKLRVAGNSYTGVGLNDCIRAARDVVKGLVDGTKNTGLETFLGGRKWSWVDPNEYRIN
ncbi:oxygen-dependent protoporphyrinogen oxidase [Lecanora helva]